MIVGARNIAPAAHMLIESLKFGNYDADSQSLYIAIVNGGVSPR